MTVIAGNPFDRAGMYGMGFMLTVTANAIERIQSSSNKIKKDIMIHIYNSNIHAEVTS